MNTDKIETLDFQEAEKTPDQQAVDKFLCQYIVPDDKLKALETWLKNMRAKNPQMKTGRLLRKGAEYFRLKKIKLMHSSESVSL